MATKSKKEIKGLPAGYEPSEAELKKYHNKWDGLDSYVAHEEALGQIFRVDPAFRLNTDMRYIIIKCSALNDFYSTNIYNIFDVAKKIIGIKDIDRRLEEGDPKLVGDIASVEGRVNYSFATKYCSHHRTDKFPIYDRYVGDVLKELRKRNPKFFKFKNDDLKDYPKFRAIIDTFMHYYHLDSYTYKDIDRYLWQLGKDYYNPYTN